MVDMALVEQNRAAMSNLSALVKGATADFVLNLDLASPEASRDALLEFMPSVVASFGDVAEVLSLDHYRALRAASGARGSFNVTAPLRTITDEIVGAKVRYLAGHLWTPEPEAILPALQNSVDKYVKQPGRDVMSFNAYREKVRYARVPAGPETCSFCLVMASRSASDTAAGYRSRESALTSKATGEAYHGGNCKCEAVRIGRGEEYPSHYLPDDFLAMYQEAARAAGSTDLNDVTYAMRGLFPDKLSDGVHRADDHNHRRP